MAAEASKFRGGRVYILVIVGVRVARTSAHARERVSARIYGWGPGAEPLAGVQGAEPPEALGF